MSPIPWSDARAVAYAAGRSARPDPVDVPLAAADGLILASALTTLTDLPAFPTSSVDGYAIRGEGPWRVVGRVLAGSVPGPLDAGQAVEIATGAMVPAGTEQIIRVEESTLDADGRVDGRGRPTPEWREPGDEAAKGDDLLPAGVPVTPGLIGLAASCGYESLSVIPAPRVAVVVFGDELLTSGPPGDGRVRDSLGPQVPAWLRRLGAVPVPGFEPRGPVEDTLDAHVAAIAAALEVADVVCTTGGTMHGPVDHLHPALAELGAEYVANTVAVRPGFPMLLATVSQRAERARGGTGPRPRFVAGLPGNPQSAIVALVSLVEPLLRGLAGRDEPRLPWVTLAEPVPGRGEFTHLVLVRVEPTGAGGAGQIGSAGGAGQTGTARPVGHAGSAMLRGLAGADGFAVIAPGTDGAAGESVPLIPLPLLPGGRP